MPSPTRRPAAAGGLCWSRAAAAIALLLALLGGAAARPSFLPFAVKGGGGGGGITIGGGGVTIGGGGISVNGMSLVGPLVLGSSPQRSGPSPKRYYKLSCDNPRPTFVVVPGISGSQLDGTQVGSNGCPKLDSPYQVYADLAWLNNLQCFSHLLSVGTDASGRLTNSSGSSVSAYEGGWPDGTDYFIWRNYYQGLWKHLEANYGYKLGVDLFAAPYDWRMDYAGMNQIGQYNQMAARISAAVAQNCGQKAILLTHSMGVNIGLGLLREPRFESWRRDNIAGLIQVGGTFSGSAASVWQTKLSGVLDPYPAYSNMFDARQLAQLPTFPVESAMFQLAQGLPSMGMLMPGAEPLGRDHVIVTTPRRSYTIGQQRELLQDQGDEQLLRMFDRIQAKSKSLLDAGPIPGVKTFCVYGIATPTPLRLEYSEDVAPGRVMRRPANIIRGPGDGSVDIKTLRLCSKLAPASHLVEIDDPQVDHSAVTRLPRGLEALDGVFIQLGMRKGAPAAAATQVDAPVSNAPSGRVQAERSGKRSSG